jgi:hypothetical protein
VGFRTAAILVHLVCAGRRPDKAARRLARTIGKHVFDLSDIAMAVDGFGGDSINPYWSRITIVSVEMDNA